MKYILFIFLFVAGMFSAQVEYRLQGTVGNIPIFFKMDDYSEQPNSDNRIVGARYFYTNTLQDIVLDGVRKGNTYELSVSDSPRDKILEKWVLKKVNANTFTGEWTNANGKKLPINLKKLNVATIKNPFDDSKVIQGLKTKDAYEYARSSFLVFKKVSTKTAFGKTIDWYSEVHSKDLMFRLPANFPAKAKTKINWELFDVHLINSLDKLGCSSSFGYSDGEGLSSSTEITYLDNNLLGFKISSDWYCGGAHPDFGSAGYLYNLNSGATFDIDDILAFHSSATTEEKSGFDAYSKYRSTYFSPALTKLMIQQFKFEKPTSEDDYCDYTDEGYWDFPAWSFTSKGIEFTPIFFRAARSCEDSFLLPFSVLKKYKNPKFPYAFPGK